METKKLTDGQQYVLKALKNTKVTTLSLRLNQYIGQKITVKEIKNLEKRNLISIDRFLYDILSEKKAVGVLISAIA